MQVTPLQLAVAYSALANGGTIVRPHLGLDVQNNAGTVLQKIDPPPSRHIHINPLYLETILAGLRAAASQPGGTSADVLGSFHQQVYGKTGTAQYITGGSETTTPGTPASCPPPRPASRSWSWSGSRRAASAPSGPRPVARQILSQWFFGKPGPYVAGTSTTL